MPCFCLLVLVLYFVFVVVFLAWSDMHICTGRILASFVYKNGNSLTDGELQIYINDLLLNTEIQHALILLPIHLLG